MTAVLKRARVRVCKVHRELMDEAIHCLNDHAAFRFDDILDALNLQLMAGSIRWDYIRDFIVEDTREDLVPVAEDYFRRHAFREELANPGTFGAGGGGRQETRG